MLPCRAALLKTVDCCCYCSRGSWDTRQERARGETAARNGRLEIAWQCRTARNSGRAGLWQFGCQKQWTREVAVVGGMQGTADEVGAAVEGLREVVDWMGLWQKGYRKWWNGRGCGGMTARNSGQGRWLWWEGCKEQRMCEGLWKKGCRKWWIGRLLEGKDNQRKQPCEESANFGWVGENREVLASFKVGMVRGRQHTCVSTRVCSSCPICCEDLCALELRRTVVGGVRRCSGCWAKMGSDSLASWWPFLTPDMVETCGPLGPPSAAFRWLGVGLGHLRVWDGVHGGCRWGHEMDRPGILAFLLRFYCQFPCRLHGM
ncbi:unnamed protein product [Ostreobium quekettii]|uniref:Uncharacterized protein n=1 Tax=Ostreobium quekettii TaxID=121088 RepID=A0A8S1J163_9CHLO|nr:unnamed protein product [Ostreobium quekettii]